MLAVVTANCLLLPLYILDLLLRGAADAIVLHLLLDKVGELLGLDDFVGSELLGVANAPVTCGDEPLPVSSDVHEARRPDAPEKERKFATAVVVLVDDASFERMDHVAALTVELQEVSAVRVGMDDGVAVPGG